VYVIKKSVRVADWSHQRGTSKGYWLIWETFSRESVTKMERISKAAFEVLKQVLPSEG